MDQDQCLICTEGEYKPLYEIKGYPLCKCTLCGFIYTPGITEDDINTFYDEDYHQGKKVRWESGSLDKSLPPSKQWLIDTYFSKPQYKSILEIGPSTNGGMVRDFARNGNHEVQCIEISDYAAAYLNDNGIPTHHGTIDNYYPEKQFDLIIATEVIEHTIDPRLFVNSVRRVLSSGGLFFVTTGNTRGRPARKGGDNWYYWDPPAHISYFNDFNIKLLFTQEGFARVQVINTGFQWLDHLAPRKMTWLLPLISPLRLSTGMCVLAENKK